MKNKRTCLVLGLAILVAFVFGAVQARADFYVKKKVHTPAITMVGQTQPEKDDISVSWMGQNKVRTDQQDGNSIILLGDKGVMYMIDNAKKEYAEMPMNFDKILEEAVAEEGEEDAEEAAEKKKIAGMMKGMMKGMMGEMSAKVTETGETKKIGDWDCSKYLIDMSMGMGSTKSEAWATQDIKFNYGLYFAAGNAMMAGQPGFEKIAQEMQKVKGFIVYQVDKVKAMGQEMTMTTEVLECTDKAAPAGTYDIPAGYKKVKGMGRGF